ncbi:hypothetical protein BCU77_23310 [Vibrio splendidus]|nr:hypothetical protein BCU77_23310 [Vibrio splendidus]
MLNLQSKFSSCNALILAFTFFLSLRFPGYATAIPILGSLIVFLLHNRFSVRIYCGFFFAITLLLIFTFIHLDSLKGAVKIIACIFSYFVMHSLVNSPYTDVANTRSLFRKLVVFFLIYSFIETILRMFFGDYFTSSTSVRDSQYALNDFFALGKFYQYKGGSPFFTDSNFAGLFLFCWFIFHVHFKSFIFSRKTYYFVTFLFTVVAFFTFSRSLYLSFLFVYLFKEFFDRFKKSYYIYLVPIILLLSSIVVVNVFLFLSDDGSLNTKLDIWRSLFSNFFEYPIINQLFGFGLEQGKYIYSYREGGSSHALIPQLVGDVGIIGLILYTLSLIYIFGKVENGLIYFLGIFLIGFSLFDPWDPLVFAIAGLLNFKFDPYYIDNYKFTER